MFGLLKLLLFPLLTVIEEIWSKVPKSTKKKIIELIVAEFTELFLQYYQNYKQERSTDE